MIGFATRWSDNTEMNDPYICIGKYTTDTRMRIYDSGNVDVKGNLTVTNSLTATPSQTKISSQETLINSSITTHKPQAFA